MELHILGPVGLQLPGQRLELGSDKERIVLATLAVDVGRPVSLESLIGRLWDDDPPPHARQNAHVYISRLRSRLRQAEDATCQGRDFGRLSAMPKIISRSHTYELQAPSDSVDWHRFRRLASEAAAEPDLRAVDLLLTADALWQGEALAGLRGLWAETVRRSLSERRLAATVSRTAAQLRLGQYAEVLGELSALVEHNPQNEALLGQLTLAYYGAGRFGEALRVQQEARHMLWSEYGARPGPELDRIHHGILERMPAAQLVRILTAPSPGTARPHVPSRSRTSDNQAAAVPRTLPHQTRLVGRSAELAELTGKVAPPDGSVILVETVSGMPGIGKTAVAVHTADLLSARYPAGQLYLDLRAHSPAQEPMTTGEALTTLLRMLGAPAAAVPVDHADQVSLWRAMMAERRAILVLDDASNATQVEPLLPDKSPSLVIITSRRHLAGITATRSVTLDILPTDDAVELFRSFAGRDRTRDAAQVTRVVQQCGLLPLAIELVATRFLTRPSWTLTTLSERLSRDPDRLGEIHNTETEVARAFELSYRTLTELQRKAFRWLSLHPGADFTLDVAAAMLDLTPTRTERVLEGLLACHLLREQTPDRYRYHDLVRQFARQIANAEDASPVRDMVLTRLTNFYLHAAESADRLAYPRRLRLEPITDDLTPHLAAWLSREAAKAWLTRERANLLAAAHDASIRGNPEHAARLGYLLAGFLNAECHWRDSAEVLERAVTHWSDQGPDAFRCRALLDLATSHTSTGRYPEADKAGTQALEIAQATGDSKVEGEALRILGTLAWSRGDSARALRTYQRSLAVKLVSGDLWEISGLHSNIGVAMLFLGENDQASQQFEKAITGFKDSGDLVSAAKVINNTGDQHLRNGDLESARRAFEESLAFLESAGNRYDQATLRSNLADVLMELGQTEAALPLYHETLLVFQELGDQKSRCEALIGIGEAHRTAGDLERAVQYHQESLEVANAIGAAHQEAQALRCLGRTELSLARLDSAIQHLRSAAATAIRIQELDEIVEAHTILADALIAAGDTIQARSVLRAAIDAIGDLPSHPKARAISDRLVALGEY